MRCIPALFVDIFYGMGRLGQIGCVKFWLWALKLNFNSWWNLLKYLLSKQNKQKIVFGGHFTTEHKYLEPPPAPPPPPLIKGGCRTFHKLSHLGRGVQIFFLERGDKPVKMGLMYKWEGGCHFFITYSPIIFTVCGGQ